MLKELRYGDLKYAKRSTPKDFDAECISLDFLYTFALQKPSFRKRVFRNYIFLKQFGYKILR